MINIKDINIGDKVRLLEERDDVAEGGIGRIRSFNSNFLNIEWLEGHDKEAVVQSEGVVVDSIHQDEWDLLELIKE